MSTTIVVAATLYLIIMLGTARFLSRKHARARRIFLICHRCNTPFQIDAITDHTIGQWGERFTCEICRSVTAPDRQRATH